MVAGVGAVGEFLVGLGDDPLHPQGPGILEAAGDEGRLGAPVPEGGPGPGEVELGQDRRTRPQNPDRGSPGIIRSAFSWYSFRSTSSGRSMP